MKDRLAALQAVCGTSGSTGGEGDLSASVSVNLDSQTAVAARNGNTAAGATQAAPQGALVNFLAQCTVLQQRIDSMNSDVDKLHDKHNSILFTPGLDAQQAEKERVTADELGASIRKNATQIRTSVKALEAQIKQEQAKSRATSNGHGNTNAAFDNGKSRASFAKRNSIFERYLPFTNSSNEADAPSGVDVDPANQSADMRIKVGHYSALNRKFYDAYLRFNNEQREYSDKCKEQLTKQILIVDPTANDEQVAMKLESGGNVFSADLLAQTAEAKRQLADIQARHSEIIKLERSIRELHDLFVDIQMFVAEQGEVVDRIETAVENSSAYVEGGKEQLTKASTYQKQARKKKICIIAVVSIILVAVILAIVIPLVKK